MTSTKYLEGLMTTNTNAKTMLHVGERAFDSKDDGAEPTTLRLVISGVVVGALLLAAFAFGW